MKRNGTEDGCVLFLTQTLFKKGMGADFGCVL